MSFSNVLDKYKSEFLSLTQSYKTTKLAYKTMFTFAYK